MNSNLPSVESRSPHKMKVLFSTLLAAATIGNAQTCIVDWNDVHQRIDGFGASSAFSQRTWSDATADLFFTTNVVGTNQGIGLSLLRNQIQPGGFASASEFGFMLKASQRGARVWSAPWTPQASFKDNNNTVGGNFLSASNQAYAAQLANYAKTNIAAGVNLYAISIQNEPDATVTYVSCHWTPQQIHDFTTNLYNAFQASNVNVKIVLPESQNWTDPQGLGSVTMNDPNSAAAVGIIANHNYVANNVSGDTANPAAVNNHGKALWETEVAQLNGVFDPTMNNGIYWAQRIHLFLTVAQANAWHYWWLISSSTDNSGLMGNINGLTGDLPTKRMYVLGQFSRFVRPNYYRIGITNVTGNVMVSAFKDSVSHALAIVAINTNLVASITQTFSLTNFDASSVTPWITSDSSSLGVQSAVVVLNASFTYTLPPLSVVTFVGQGNTPPKLTPIVNRTNNVGVPLVVTNAATDSDQPPQTLTFNLLNGPTHATLNASNGVFMWRPLVSQARTANVVTVSVTDDGSPNLSATNSFTVTVNPLNRPVFRSISVGEGRVNLVADGDAGPDYTLLTSTNLFDWSFLRTTNSPAVPVTFVITNTAEPVRFYRLQLGP